MSVQRIESNINNLIAVMDAAAVGWERESFDAALAEAKKRLGEPGLARQSAISSLHALRKSLLQMLCNPQSSLIPPSKAEEIQLLMAEGRHAEAAAYLIANRAIDMQANGPGPENRYWWNGQYESLQPLDWRLVDMLTNNGETDVEDAIDKVWGHGASDAALSSAKTRINRAFKSVGAPKRIQTKSGKLSIKAI